MHLKLFFVTIQIFHKVLNHLLLLNCKSVAWLQMPITHIRFQRETEICVLSSLYKYTAFIQKKMHYSRTSGVESTIAEHLEYSRVHYRWPKSCLCYFYTDYSSACTNTITSTCEIISKMTPCTKVQSYPKMYETSV